MNTKTTRFASWPFYLFVTGVFCILVAPNLLSDGMFMDGLIYSAIAKNLAHGLGTFWNPHFSQTCLPEFHEHPPLALWIQSFFYRMLGDSRYVEKVYSILTVVVAGILLVKTWRQLGYAHSWLPLMFWISIPVVSWAGTNNMLENTLTIFTSFSVLFFLKGQKKYKYLFLFLSGFSLTLGFLTKGFVAFFPWMLPFLFWFFKRKTTAGKMVLESLGMIAGTLVPLLLLILFFPDARLSLQKYLDQQVINSLRNVVTVDSRFFILKRLLTELIPAFIICLVIILLNYHNRKKSWVSADKKTAVILLSLGLCGVLPIMISLKQSGFYMLAVFPFLAIAISGVLLPSLKDLMGKWEQHPRWTLIFRWISGIVFLFSLVLLFSFKGKVNREKEKIKDTYTILSQLPKGEVINILPEMWDDWELQGLYVRYKNISLDPKLDRKRTFLLVNTGQLRNPAIVRDYERVILPTKKYNLYRKKI